MKKIYFILLLSMAIVNSKAQSDDFFGGVELGLSTTKLHLDSIDVTHSFSPLIGFSFQKQIFPKFYGGISTIFTRKNAKLNSPSVSYQLNYIDWRLSFQYRIQPSLFLEGGGALSQFISGRTKSSNDLVVDQSDNFFHQTNPYLGLRYKIKENIISIKYYLPNTLLNSEQFSTKNQFSYGEVSLNIPFKTNSENKLKKNKALREEAEKQIKSLKSGILLVTLSGSKSKDVNDRELDQLLVSAFKDYTFSKFFIVDENDIDSLRKTNRISVYEDYPFTEKQSINLENFTWFIVDAGKASVSQNEGGNTETYNMNAIIISNSDGDNLKSPFPFYLNYSEGNISDAVKSLESQLARFYYEANFGL